MEISIEKTINGYLVLYAIVGGYLMRRTYIGYTRKQARAMFRAEARGK